MSDDELAADQQAAFQQAALQHYMPLHDAARRVVNLVQRGPLPPQARQALLELQVALTALSLAKVVEASFDEEDEAADEAADQVRLSA